MSRIVTIVGVGALGSHVAQFLRNVGDVQFRLIDFDVVEQKNTQSQFHGKPHIGRRKVESMKQTMGLLWGFPRAQVMTSKLVADNVEALLGDSALVIDCLDNGVSRRLVQKYAREKNVPCLHGALGAGGTFFGRVVWDEHFKIDDEAGAGAATCEDGAELPFITVVSSYLAWAAQRFLVEGKRVGFSVTPQGAIRV